MQLTILGCYAATPRTFTNPTAQVLEIRNHLFLIDCGEATQVQLRRQKVKFSKISHIFISHLHGDHVYGLIGLVSTFMLFNRTSDLHIYGPVGIKELITMQLRLSNSWTTYGLFFHELSSQNPEVIFEDSKVIVSTIPLKHRIYTNGFLFREKPAERKLNFEAVQKYRINMCWFQNIKDGKDVTLDDGTQLENAAITFDPPKPQSYAFCSDTVFDPQLVDHLKDVNVLYHESTFLDSEAALAERTMHATASQAATIARDANVSKLILGHYSTRYPDLSLFLEEASPIFPNAYLADDGKTFEI